MESIFDSDNSGNYSNKIRSLYDEAISYIEEIPKFTKKNTLEHTACFLDRLGINEDNMKIIHVAGTNGKGSVCAILSNILTDSGKSTGLFTSPHLITHNERIRINNEQIGNEEFLKLFLRVKDTVSEMEQEGYPHPSYFEFLFLMAMYEFALKNVEYVILETGLGGRLDATNVIKRPVLTIITQIGLDHMEYLGDTVSMIAGEKAGIIKKQIPVVFWAEDNTVKAVILSRAEEMRADVYPVYEKDYKIKIKTDKGIDFSVQNGYYFNCTFRIPFISEYQVKNTMVALKAVSLLEIRDNISKIKASVAKVKWEGRMETVEQGVILDGAHNGPGIDEFVKTFNEYACKGRKKILFSVVKDKDYEYMVLELSKTSVSKIYITQINSDRALSIDKIEEDFRNNSCKAEIVLEPDIIRAYGLAVSERQSEDVLFCVGSLYLIGEIKRYIQSESD